jgi:hypothetical protein
VQRDPEELRRSWAAEIEKAGLPPSPYPASIAYRGPAPWLLDVEAMLAPFRQVLGAHRVHVVDYEDGLDRYGSVIPAILEPFGVDPSALPDWSGEWQNVTRPDLVTARRLQDPTSALGRRLAVHDPGPPVR